MISCPNFYARLKRLKNLCIALRFLVSHFQAQSTGGTRVIQALAKKKDQLNSRLLRLFADRCKIEPIPLDDLYNRQSIFWARQAPVSQEIEIANAFCTWQGSVQEEALLRNDLKIIRAHSVDDMQTLADAYTREIRIFAKELIQSRIVCLNEKILMLDRHFSQLP